MRGVDIAVVLVATALCPNFIIAKQELTPSDLPNCPSEKSSFLRTYYPNPDDKSTFYLCSLGVPILYQCPANLVWNSQLENCVPQEDVHTTDPEANHIKCTAGDGAKDALLPNLENSGTFFQCENGVPVLQYCPEGMDWNDEYKYCNYPEHVHRFVAGESGYKPRTDVDITIHDPGTYIYGCPDLGGPDGVLLPHDTNCNEYYKCKNGIPMLQICPSGQWWNDRDKICDSPENAQCAAMTTTGPSTTDLGNNSDGCPYVDNPYRDVLLPNPWNCKTFFKCKNGVPTLQNCSFGMEWNDRLKRCDTPGNAQCAEMTTTGPSTTDPGINSYGCPFVDNPYRDVLLPNPMNCKTFFKCINGVHTLQNCSFGMEWNDRLKRCDSPGNAQCAEMTTTGPSTTDPGINSYGCPFVDNPYRDVLLPNPMNCKTFFKCINGVPTLQNCSFGMEWNDRLKRCDSSGNAQCSETTTTMTTSDAGTNTSYSVTGESTSIISTSVEVTPSEPTSSVQMTTSDLGTSEAFTTSNFQTTVHITEAFTTSNYQTTVHITTSKPETNSNGCPTENGPKDVLLSNPDNCFTFFKCKNGIPVLQYCPPDLEWNDETKYCEYSEIPHCNIPESTEPNSAPYTSREVSISTPRHTVYFTIIFFILMWSGTF